MDKTLARIGQLDEFGDVLNYVRDCCIDCGCARLSYHFTPIFDAPTSIDTVIYAHGFDQEWLQLYEQMDFRKDDPIPARTMQFGSLIEWRDAMRAAANTEGNERYFAAMREHGLEHGFGLPLFGPHGRNAYASFDFGKPLATIGTEVVATVVALARTGHLRICRLLEQAGSHSALSEREQEVLEWVARGKSNTDIAVILGISPETVRTYVRRIFAKLAVHDRIGAAIKGLKLGLFHV